MRELHQRGPGLTFDGGMYWYEMRGRRRERGSEGARERGMEGGDNSYLVLTVPLSSLSLFTQ